jgi:hypothetical protein
MRQVLLGLFGVLAAGAAHAETYSFTSVINGTFNEQTLINCTGPKTNGAERVPKGCVLSEPALAYPNHEGNQHLPAVTCASGQPIEFYPNGTLAECVLHSQQVPNVPGIAACKGRVRFDKDGRAEC